MILISGGTGTVGGEVLRRLAEGGGKVRVLVRDAARAAGLGGGSVELVEGDLGDRRSLEAALAGIDRAFLLTPVGERSLDLDRNFIEAARASGVRRIVRLSALGADPAAPSVILRMHAAADEHLRASGLEWTSLRPNAFLQNLLASAESVRTGSISLSLGEAKQSMIDARDIGAVAARALAAEDLAGQILELTGPEPLSGRDIAAAFSKVLGRKIQYFPITHDDARRSLQDSGLPAWDAAAVSEIFRYFATGALARTTDAVEEVLGREPTDIRTFLRDHADRFRTA